MQQPKWHQRWAARLEFDWQYFKLLPKSYPSELVANYIEWTFDWFGFRLAVVKLGVDRSNVETLVRRAP